MENERKKAINSYLLGVKSRDERSLELLYKEISPTIRYIALKYLKNSADADDLVQDFWADIYKIADGFLLSQNAFSYLAKIMTRKAINRYKLLNRHKKIEVNYVDYGNFFQHSVDIEQLAINECIETAMKKLSKTERIIIQSTYFEDKTVRYIAKELKISKSQVSKIKIQAIEKMKSYISEYYVDE